MSVPGNFSPQELIGHFLWMKRKTGKKLGTLTTRGRQPLLTPDIPLRRPAVLLKPYLSSPPTETMEIIQKKYFLTY